MNGAFSESRGESVEQELGRLLRGRGWRLAVAESCTGGLVSQRITTVAGSSDYFLGGVVAYANAVKVSQLGVCADLLAADGAVSPTVARAMATGVRERLQADVALGVTGIAGPDGGTAEKPVGTVFIGLAGPAGDRAEAFRFGGDRAAVRQAACRVSLELLCDFLSDT